MAFPAFHAFDTTVVAVRLLSPGFLRITLGAEQLLHFGTGGCDQRVKLVLPLPDGSIADFGLFEDPAPQMSEWFARWRQLDEHQRNPLRTYTARSIRPESRELDIDFVMHPHGGPASRWAERARVGDRLVIVGPDARAESPGGIEWRPGSARRVLLAGDETAVPAIAAILEQLPPEFDGNAYIEVPRAADILPVTSASRVRQHWLGRNGAPHGRVLLDRVGEWGRMREPVRADATEPGAEDPGAEGAAAALWEVPDSTECGTELYAWLAGEAGTITALRRLLVAELGVDRRSVAFMGYWRRGHAE